jgi:hypothetical protein
VNIKFVNNALSATRKATVVRGVKTKNDIYAVGSSTHTYGVAGELSLIISRNAITAPNTLGTVDFYPSLDLNHLTNFTFWNDFRNAI